MQNIKNKVSSFVICCSLILMATSAWAVDRITQIKVIGTERIEPSTVISYIDIRVGDDFSEYKVSQSLKSLFKTGLFSDVSLYQDGSELVITVVENPIINQIAFEGNDELKDEDLQAELQLRPRVVLTRTKVGHDLDRLLGLYRFSGHFSASIEPKIIKLDQNRVNLVFEINEGPEAKIQKVNFVGNKRFDDGKLQSIITSKETKWFRFLTSNDKYDPDRLGFDQELLRRFYLNHGYVDFNIKSAVAELTSDKKDFFLTFTVDEGVRYKVGDVTLDNNIEDFDKKPLQKAINVRSGNWYNAKDVEENVVNLTDEIGKMQYAFVDVRPRVKRNNETKTVDVSFVLNEGAKVFVEEIDINGNVRTLDEVIRREMQLVEGDAFNAIKLRESEQNIKDLNFFETVKIRPRQGSTPNKRIIGIDVEEKSTGELSIGAGFSSSDGPLADFKIKEKNLLGKGQELAFSTTLSGVRTEFDLSFTEPFFLNRDLRAGFDVFHITRDLQDESSFDQRQSGGGLRIGYPIAQYWRQSLNYRFELNEITDVQTTASRFIQDQEGQRTTSAVSQALVYDRRDSKLDPTEGLIFRLNTEFAGLGGNAQYISSVINGTYFYPIRDKWIFRTTGEVGYIFGWGDEDVKINERFFLGGSTLRGFETAGVGPRDTLTDDSLGGNRYARGTVELGMPSGLSEEFGVRLHIFSDFGVIGEVDESGVEIADEETLRLSLGGGISWRSPLGPIRVDLAAPVLKEDFDEKEIFRFSFGTSF